MEASDGIGGRVRTDKLDGFLLDRGFQVYLDAYPEAGIFLDHDELDLRPFRPGALVWKRGKLRPIMDVFRCPSKLISSAVQPIGTLFDKLLVAKLRGYLLRKTVEEIWATPDRKTSDYLLQFGFSDRMINDFFRGFYGGIFLEDELVTSSRIFEFTFKMFSLGSATLPARGMQAIPDQLAKRLPVESIRLDTSVTAVSKGRVETEGGAISCECIVVATDGETAAKWISGVSQSRWNSTSCLYFAAPQAPWKSPLIALKGDRPGKINSVSVPSVIAPEYAEGEEALVSVSVLGDHGGHETLAAEVQEELEGWFGKEAQAWRFLRCEHIRKALPNGPPGNQATPPRYGSIFCCGDSTTTGSIEGAILSGVRTANQILGDDERT